MSLENYEIIKELGRGGMGAVFLANDKRLKRHVAIKVLKIPHNITDPQAVKDTINNFKREAVAIANLSHNNIVGIYDIGEKNGMHYIVMELIEGSSLSKLLKLQGQPFPLEYVLKISDEICDALHYIHKNKVIHRDIKPENIIYTSKGVAKLTDFGIAKFEGDKEMESSNKGGITGTILYMSPEQLQDPDGVDGRADMYSMAVSIYELLTGKLPFMAETPREAIMKILKDEPVPPSKLSKDLLPHVDPIIIKAMSKDRDRRFSNVEEFREELKKISEYRSKFAIQPIKLDNKKDSKIVYSTVSIDDIDDVKKYYEKLPEIAKQRIIYEFEMLIAKFLEEYKDKLQNTENKTPEVKENKIKQTSNFIESLNYIIPLILPAGLSALTSMSIPIDLIKFIGKINGTNTLYQIINQYYSFEDTKLVLDMFYNSIEKKFINVKIIKKTENPILIGEILTAFKYITENQLRLVLDKKKFLRNDILIGEILVENSYITKDKLMDALKFQAWYKKLFL